MAKVYEAAVKPSSGGTHPYEVGEWDLIDGCPSLLIWKIRAMAAAADVEEAPDLDGCVKDQGDAIVFRVAPMRDDIVLFGTSWEELVAVRVHGD